ncbi:MAG TPA: hypothetical protein VH054_07730 [Polyangiaceae bacterium]|jgi:hypothetical protein|nr:hypothetical protein [Polyangiaceae bacterium]
MRGIVALSLLTAACGGSTIEGDAGTDGGVDVVANDSPSQSDVIASDTSPPQQYDGVVGKACTTDKDCATTNGPNLARCSNTVFNGEDFFPTAVCILPSCTPVTSSSGVHYCDGPDDPSSPGICVTSGTSGSACVPKCTYDKQGGAPKGCVGKDVCNSYPITAAAGVGYCFGGCTQDGDCQDGQKCQTDRGWCLPGVTPPTKNVGDACTASDLDALVCNCLYGTSKTGYCSSFCIVGGAACPSGFTCDSLEIRASGFTTPNAGMAGYCTASCAGDAAACTTNATCTNVFAAGPDCIPP